MPPDYMERNYIRIQGYTVPEPDTGDDMEHGTSPWNGSPPHTGRRKKNQRGDPKRDSRERKFPADAAGRNSGPPTRG
jgi:hypothetical protein